MIFFLNIFNRQSSDNYERFHDETGNEKITKTTNRIFLILILILLFVVVDFFEKLLH